MNYVERLLRVVSARAQAHAREDADITASLKAYDDGLLTPRQLASRLYRDAFWAPDEIRAMFDKEL